MKSQTYSLTSVPSELYTHTYFWTDCDGYDWWLKYSGRRLCPRLRKSFQLGKVQRGMTVLDYGCGRGEIVVQSALRGAKVIGVDYSKAALDLTRESISKLPPSLQKNVTLLSVEGKPFPFERDVFDVIFFLDVMEHLYPEELKAILGELHRCLKKKGRMILHTAPNKIYYDYGYRYYSRFLFRALNFAYKAVHGKDCPSKDAPRRTLDYLLHVNEQTPGKVRATLKQAGFRAKVWLSDWHEVTNLEMLVLHLFIKPSLIFPLHLLFANNIWAICSKK